MRACVRAFAGPHRARIVLLAAGQPCVTPAPCCLCAVQAAEAEEWRSAAAEATLTKLGAMVAGASAAASEIDSQD
eukprot:COSAG01_NODE_1656_length_9595_cov_4.929150_9_plen_75_part_00